MQRVGYWTYWGLDRLPAISSLNYNSPMGLLMTHDVEVISPGSAVSAAKDNHPRVTERQAELVDTLLSTGGTHRELAEALGADRAWVSRTLRKQHVLDYMAEVARRDMRTLGAAAMVTARELLQARSEKVRSDVALALIKAGGLDVGQDTQRAPAVAVQINLDGGGGPQES